MSSLHRLDPERYRVRPGDAVEFSEIDLDQEAVIMDGKRYTETDAATDTDWLEATIEERHDERTRGLQPGGKSLSGGRTHSPRIQVVLPADCSAEVHRRANAEGMSVSRWARRVIERELAAA